MQPSLVIVYFGGNDSVNPHPSGLGTHVPLQEYIENMRKIAIHLKVEFHTRLSLPYFSSTYHHMKEETNHIFNYYLDKNGFSLPLIHDC